MNRADAEIEELVQRFVLIGLPDRYLRAQLLDPSTLMS